MFGLRPLHLASSSSRVPNVMQRERSCVQGTQGGVQDQDQDQDQDELQSGTTRRRMSIRGCANLQERAGGWASKTCDQEEG